MVNVNPFNITKKMSKIELEYWILFGICVAGKGAKQTEKKLAQFLTDIPQPTIKGQSCSWIPPATPFEIIQYLKSQGKLLKQLRKHRTGQYKRITQAFSGVIGLDLNTVSVRTLEAVKGIGPKTARMIMMYYDRSLEVACLDTHILKYLEAQGIKNVPRSTPPAGKTYKRLEQEFIKLAKQQRMTVQELDTQVWLSYAKQ